ncbi:uncharacterized protein DEA37_0011776, partial [Paragonimus westermani]
RKRRSVEAQNISFFSLIEEALPKDLRLYFKTPDGSPPSSKHTSVNSTDFCPALPSPMSLADRSATSGAKDKTSCPLSACSKKQVHHQSNRTSSHQALMTAIPPDLCPIVPTSLASDLLVETDQQLDVNRCCMDNALSCTFRHSTEHGECKKSTDPFTSVCAWHSEHLSMLDLPDCSTLSSVASDCKPVTHSQCPKTPSSVCSTASVESSSSSSISSISSHPGCLLRNRQAALVASLNESEMKNSTRTTNTDYVETSSGKATVQSSSNGVSRSGGVGGSGAGSNGGGGKQGPNSNSGSKSANKDEYTLKLSAAFVSQVFNFFIGDFPLQGIRNTLQAKDVLVTRNVLLSVAIDYPYTEVVFDRITTPLFLVSQLEVEVKQLKAELQSLRGLEVDLRGQVQQLTAAERTYRSESSQARQEFEALQAKCTQLSQRLEADKASLQSAEQQLTDERKRRMVLEQQLAVQKQQQQQQQQSSTSVKGRKNTSLGTDGAQNFTATGKVSTSKSPRGIPTTGVNQSTNTVVTRCTCSESCSSRVRELEAELRALTRDSAAKDIQLAALKGGRLNHGLNGPNTSERSHDWDKSETITGLNADHVGRAELLSKLHSLQEENQRMTDTLKEEDKMKQELMTAYHASLKEITELNASLTQKEYQIVELNMRVERLTPQFCEYVKMMSVSKSASPNQSDDQQSSCSNLVTVSLRRQPSMPNQPHIKQGSHHLRKLTAVSDDQSFPVGRSTQPLTNGLNQAMISEYFGSSTAYPNSAYVSNYLDSVRIRSPPPSTSVGAHCNLNSLDHHLSNQLTNGSAGTSRESCGSSSTFQSNPDSCDLFAQTTNSQHSVLFTQPSSARTLGNLTHSSSSHLNAHQSTCYPYQLPSPTSYPQHNRFKPAYHSSGSNFPGSITRLMVNTAPTSSPLPFLAPPPGLMNSNINVGLLNTPPFANEPHSYTTAHTTTPSLIHSPVNIENALQGSTSCASSINCLMESLSPVGTTPNQNCFNSRRDLPHDSFSLSNRSDDSTSSLVQQSNPISVSAGSSVLSNNYRSTGHFMEAAEIVDNTDFSLMGLGVLDQAHHRSGGGIPNNIPVSFQPTADERCIRTTSPQT